MVPNVCKRIGVMLCKKSVQTNSFGRLTTAPEDLLVFRKTYISVPPEDLLTAPEHLLTAAERLLTAPEHFCNCSRTLS